MLKQTPKPLDLSDWKVPSFLDEREQLLEQLLATGSQGKQKLPADCTIREQMSHTENQVFEKKIEVVAEGQNYQENLCQAVNWSEFQHDIVLSARNFLPIPLKSAPENLKEMQ